MTTLEALQETLAAEHAAVYVYGVLGGRAAPLTDPRLHTALAAAYDAHVGRRDQLRRMVTALGGDPVAAEPAYRLPRTLTSAARIAARALLTERSCVAQYGALVAAADPGATRAWAVVALGEGALAELDFSGHPQALPGVTA